MKRILIVLILLVFQSFAYKSSFDTVAMNRIILKRADTSITPAMFLMKDSANDTVKFLPYSSAKSGTADTSTWSKKPKIASADAADTNVLAFDKTDTTFKWLTRNQLRTAVDSVRKSDSASGSARFGGWTKARSDSMIFCDTPYVPYASTSQRYLKSMIRQNRLNIEISDTNPTFAGLGQLSKSWYGVASDPSSSNIYAVVRLEGLFKRTNGSGNFGLIYNTSGLNTNINGLTVTKTGNIYIAFSRSGPSDSGGLYIYDISEDTFAVYKKFWGTQSVNAVGCNNNGDIYVGLFGGKMYRQVAESGTFDSVAGNANWQDFAYDSITNDMYVSVYGGDIYKQTNSTGAFVGLGYTSRNYSGLCIDKSRSLLAAVQSVGVYKRIYGSTQLNIIYSNNQTWDGLCSDTNNGIYLGLSGGDVYYQGNSVKYIDSKLVIDASTSINGSLRLPAIGMYSKLTRMNPLDNSIDTTGIFYNPSGKYVDFPSMITLSDSNSYSVPGFIYRHVKTADSGTAATAFGLAIGNPGTGMSSAYGSWIYGESNAQGGRLQFACGDSGKIHFIAPKKTQAYFRWPRGHTLEKPNVEWRVDDTLYTGWRDSLATILQVGKNSDSSSFRLYGGKGSSSTYSEIEMGSGVSNRITISTDSLVLPENINISKGAYGNKFKITQEGGYAIKMINRTGATSVKGYLASPSPSYDTSCTLSTVNIPDNIGVFYESGIANGSETWVVVSGIADVYFVGNATRGHIARGFVTGDAGYVAGQALSEAVPSSPFATDKHFYEVGHVIQNRTGAGLAKCVLHQN